MCLLQEEQTFILAVGKFFIFADTMEELMGIASSMKDPAKAERLLKHLQHTLEIRHLLDSLLYQDIPWLPAQRSASMP